MLFAEMWKIMEVDVSWQCASVAIVIVICITIYNCVNTYCEHKK